MTETEPGAPIPIGRGVPTAWHKGTRVTLRAETNDDCDLFVGWLEPFESSDPVIEFEMDSSKTATATFVDGTWVEPTGTCGMCGVGSCQALCVTMLILGFIRIMPWPVRHRER